MENSAETSPLLNDYKLEYFLERLPQTILGGPVLKVGPGRQKLPWYIHLYQFILFATPLVLSSFFTIIVDIGLVKNYWMSIAFGCVMTTFMIIIHLGLRGNSKKSLEEFQETDEDEVEFQGCTGIREAWRFIVHVKRYTINIAIHALLYGIVNGIAFLYLLPSSSKLVFGNVNASVVYFVIGWIAACIGSYGLIGRLPAEPCQFRATDQYEISTLTRPFYMICFGIFGVFAICYPELRSVDFILRILFACLPVIWTFGILPPLDCFFLWLGEQALVHLFGGSPMANKVRLIVMLLLSCIIWLIIYAISNNTVALAFAACLGLILSMDVSTGLEKIFLLFWMRSERPNNNSKRPTNASSYSLLKCSYFILVLVSTGLISALVSEVLTDSRKGELIDTFGYISLSVFIAERTFGSMLMLYTFFGIFSNPMYFLLRKGKGRRVLVLFQKILANSVVPLVLVSFITLSAAKSSNGTTESNLLFALFAFRAYHLAWQDQQKCALDVSVVMVIRYSSLKVIWWNDLDIHTQLFFISFFLNRIEHTWNLISFAVRFGYKFFFNQKVRHQSYKVVALIITIMSPFLLFLFCLCSILYAPLLPIFTLPIFLMGYPRPQIFWPYADTKLCSSSNDWIYYRQLMPSLLNSLKDTISSGSLGGVKPGEHFLARFQDRLIWLVVAERGFLHTNIIAKGLELAETSCHTVEAGRIDDMFEVILGDKPRPILNPYPGHCLVPCDIIELETYSDARNVLTGIIDSPENLSKLSDYFLKSLTWVLLRFSKSRRNRGLGDGPTVDELKAKFEAKQKKAYGKTSSLLTNETRETVVVSKADSIGGILHERTSSSHSKSSLSENSMTALWNNREPLKMVPLKSGFGHPKSSIPADTELPSVHFTPSGKKNKKEAVMKRNSFKGPNLVMDDDFDDFGFDDFDENLPRPDSAHSLDNLEYDSKTTTDSIFERCSMNTDLVGPNKMNRQNTLPSLVVDVSSPHSSMLEPPIRWKQSIPIEASDLSIYQNEFSEDWFKFVISQLGLESKGERILQSISADRGLFFIFRRLVLSCYFVINEQLQKHALDVWKTFSGSLPWSRYLYWVEQDTELQQQIILAYRYAFKLMYDEAVLGPIDDFEELAEYLLDYEENWHMGDDHDEQWMNAVLSEVPNLLSVGYDKNDGTFTSRVLSMQKMSVPIGRLDSENVKAIWSSLSLELLYFTNDDEERFSIQAHPSHLRNITIQAADPPFGYPVYSSGLLNVVAW